MVVCDNMLIVLRAELTDENYLLPNEFHPEGIYVFDLEDFSQKHFLDGEYDYLVKAADDERTVLAFRARDAHIDLLALEKGHLSRKFSFSLPSYEEVTSYHILLVYQSYVYVFAYRYRYREGNEDSTRIEVYNILNGERVCMFGSAWVVGASTNGSELFVGTDAMCMVYSLHANVGPTGTM